MEIKVIRPNPEIGVLAHMAGVVKINQSGTLQEMREDINRAIPTYLGSLKFLFLSRKFFPNNIVSKFKILIDSLAQEIPSEACFFRVTLCFGHS